MFKRLFDFFTSLKLTAVCLGLGLVLVFAGTIAQVEQGLYQAQARYFQSLFVLWGPAGASWQIPIFPGGYLIGGVMLLNLIATGIERYIRYKLAPGQLGLLLIHGGIILLLVGQLFTELQSEESAMELRVGETKQYSEAFRTHELAVIDATDPESQKVVAIPEAVVARGGEMPLPGLPITLRVRQYWLNADILNQAVGGAVPSQATEGVGQGRFVQPQGAATRMDARNSPAAVLEFSGAQGLQGTWLASTLIDAPQRFTSGGRTYQFAFRARRYYTPFSLTLLDCSNEVYAGSSIAKNFSSRVRVNDSRGETREVLIKMNDPLRHGGNTYYQFQMAPRESAIKSSTLQVVRNPGWLTPYVSCTLVGVGLVWHFLASLVGFLKERRNEN